MRLRTALAPLALVAATSAVALPSASSAAKPARCAAGPGTLAVNTYSRVFREGRKLKLCTVVSRRTPATRTIGTWVKGTKVTLRDGDAVAWTRPVAGGQRISAATIGGRWLSGQRAIPATPTAKGIDGKVLRILVTGDSAAWVTRDGTLAMALADPQEVPRLEDAGGADVPLASGGPADDRAHGLLVARFTPADAPALVGSLKLSELGGDGDECGGGTTFTLRFTAPADSAPSTVSWGGGYSTNAPGCGEGY